MASPKKIATHNGSFHCDEVLAVHILQQISEYASAEVVRSCDLDTLAAADVVLGIGGVYDFASRRFDYHQPGHSEVFLGFRQRPRKTKLSSSGLVYRHFGMEAVGNILAAAGVVIEEDEGDLETVYFKVYNAFVEAVDAITRGIRLCKVSGPPRYYDGSGLPERVKGMDAAWNEPSDDEAQAVNFEKALRCVGAEFDACVLKTAKSWLPMRRKVAHAMAARREYDRAGRVLVLHEWLPWKNHVLSVEAEEAKQARRRPVQYVVYKAMSGDEWRMYVVRGEGGLRTQLPEAWHGLTGEAFSEVAAIDGCIFVHTNNGFTGGNKTFEGAMEMVRTALSTADAVNK